MILSSNDSKRKTSSFTFPKKKIIQTSKRVDRGTYFETTWEQNLVLDSEGMKQLADELERLYVSCLTTRMKILDSWDFKEIIKFLRGD